MQIVCGLLESWKIDNNWPNAKSRVTSIDQTENNNNEMKWQSKNKLFNELKSVSANGKERYWCDYLFKTDPIIKIMCNERFSSHEINFKCDFSPEKQQLKQR